VFRELLAMTNNERAAARLLVSIQGPLPEGMVGEALQAQYKAAIEKLTPDERLRIGALLSALASIWPKG
jgi:hypothetical protein